MPVGGSDFGTLPPAGTELVLANVWYDGAVQFRSGGSVNFNTGATLPNLTGTPATTAGASVLYNTSGGVLSFVNPQGQVAAVGGVVQSQTSTVTVANTGAATALQSYTVPANDPAAGAVYSMSGWGVYSDTATPTLTFNLLWGGIAGTSLATFTTAALPATVTNVPYSYTTMITFRSPTSVTANITLNLGTATSGVASSYVMSSTTPTTVVSNVASAFVMGVTWSAASASNTISLLGGNVERIA